MQSESSHGSTPSIDSFLRHFPVDVVSTGAPSWSSGQAQLVSHSFNVMKLSDFGSTSVEYATFWVIGSLHLPCISTAGLYPLHRSNPLARRLR